MQPSHLTKFDGVSFSGCGALNFYQTGVGFGLQEAGLIEELSFAGASAGAGLSVALAGGLDARDVAAQMIEITGAYGAGRILRPAWAYEVAQEFCRRFVTPETFERSTGRIAISVTSTRPAQSMVVTQFDSQADLADALTASCFLPHAAQRTHPFRNRPCIDGGFSNNQPTIGTRCLKVSPFWFQVGSHLRPSPRVRADFALKVPTAKRAWWLFDRGLRDLQQFAAGLNKRAQLKTALRSIQHDVASTLPFPAFFGAHTPVSRGTQL
ncbi:MAG: hypothetical protein HOK97_18685 [Deltaproteobacteria bacterium]|nr:hypothetical protein [Deltaproteobacteria bacterium]